MQKRKSLYVLCAIVIFALIVIVWKSLGSSNKTQDTSVSTGTSSQNQTGGERGQNSSQSSNETQDKSQKQVSNTPVENASLQTPTGSFVSNHHPTTSSQSIESVCSTNQGATCDIKLTMGSAYKTLGTKTVGTNNSVTWVWSPSSIGLSSGTWQVMAIAELNGAQKTSNDPINLVVP